MLQMQRSLNSRCGDIILSVNGEIYNHMELEKSLDKKEFTTDSDCEVRFLRF